jgi:hypothetical protein
MRLSTLVILLSAAAVGVLAHQQAVNEPALPAPPIPLPNPQRQQQHPLLRPLPPSETESADLTDTDDGGLVSEETYDRLEHFAKYACAVYQFLCPRPLGNTLVQPVSFYIHVHPLTCLPLPASSVLSELPSLVFRFVLFCFVFHLGISSRTHSRMRMGSSRAMMNAARSSLRFGGATSLRIWSLVCVVFY